MLDEIIRMARREPIVLAAVVAVALLLQARDRRRAEQAALALLALRHGHVTGVCPIGCPYRGV
jgi:hydrogenase/urease accessory protein HupE